jgi:hypothetical protein
MWVTVVPSRVAPGTVRAAFMTMSAVACATRWAVSGRTLNGTVGYQNCPNARPGGVDRAVRHVIYRLSWGVVDEQLHCRAVIGNAEEPGQARGLWQRFEVAPHR